MWWQRHLSEFVTLFLVINPFGVLPAFLVLAAGRDSATQRRLALNAVLIAFVVLVFFLFAGEFVLPNANDAPALRAQRARDETIAGLVS